MGGSIAAARVPHEWFQAVQKAHAGCEERPARQPEPPQGTNSAHFTLNIVASFGAHFHTRKAVRFTRDNTYSIPVWGRDTRPRRAHWRAHTERENPAVKGDTPRYGFETGGFLFFARLGLGVAIVSTLHTLQTDSKVWSRGGAHPANDRAHAL